MPRFKARVALTEALQKKVLLSYIYFTHFLVLFNTDSYVTAVISSLGAV